MSLCECVNVSVTECVNGASASAYVSVCARVSVYVSVSATACVSVRAGQRTTCARSPVAVYNTDPQSSSLRGRFSSV